MEILVSHMHTALNNLTNKISIINIYCLQRNMYGCKREKVKDENIEKSSVMFSYCTAKRWMRLVSHVTRVGLKRSICRGFGKGTKWKRSLAHKCICNMNQVLQKCDGITWFNLMKFQVSSNSWDVLIRRGFRGNDSDTCS